MPAAKLHSKASVLPDQSLLELGRMSFNQQFEVFEQRAADVFGGVGREAYIQAHIHRKLHASIITLADAQALLLGRTHTHH